MRTSPHKMWEQFSISACLEVRRREEEGRGLYAKCKLPLGREVLTAEPYAYVLSNSERGRLCDCCIRPSESLLKCGRCKFVRYCSKTCQARDWVLHRRECKGISQVPPDVTPTDTMRLLIRSLQGGNTKNRTQPLPEDAKWEMELLCSHKDGLSEETKEGVAAQLLGAQAILEESVTGSFDAKVAYETICRLLCNTFSIVNAELRSIGAGIYIGPSLLNHSCEPNCVVVFDGPLLHLRTIREIQPGEQLLITYLELLDTREERRAQLQRVYHFECTCQKCLTEESKDSPHSMMYSTTDGSVSKTRRDAAMKEGLQALEAIRRREKERDFSAVVELCHISLERQATTLHLMNVITVKTLQLLRTAYIEQQDWKQALAVADKLTEPYRRYLPQYHPGRAVNFLICGKLRRLQGNMEDIELSVRDLVQAVDLLRVTYGEQHTTTVEAMDLLHDSQQELRHRQR